ncbi:MAG TPA: hypothetical protein VGV37_00705 [Aliidongia sp.]|uniref:hypothetical protein n=1 Tax=Aliidongia sp. TaxID=1914230 RepID=UPI002DDD3307|nr:hypothetical protein [Aliidongia sp.]HEV2673026.1 hypothetical protein [Aliidongia sp.]
MSDFLYIAQLAIPAEKEEEFNAIYDAGYIPALLSVPGVLKADRYKLIWSDVDEMPEYLATYELEAPEIPNSPAWKAASVNCGWAEHIRPHLVVRRHGMFRRFGG